MAQEHGAWVHVDGAFGLWAAAAPALRSLVSGLSGVDSCATDARKTLNVPYDSGIAIVMDPVPLRAIMGVHGSYLITDEGSRAESDGEGTGVFASGPRGACLGGPSIPR